jgi:hypothetical protein
MAYRKRQASVTEIEQPKEEEKATNFNVSVCVRIPRP